MKKNNRKNQGEGNREADRQYRKGATEFAKSGKQRKAAKEAKREMERGDKDMM